MLSIDLRGKRAFVAGVADDGGFGFTIAKSLAEAGATVCVGTWPPAMTIFEALLSRGKIDEARVMSDGSKLEFEMIVPLDADFDSMELVPEEIKTNRRYRERGDFTISGAAKAFEEKFGGPCFDVVVHALANGPEVKNPLLQTSRKGYLAAMSASAYSFVSLVQHFGPLMRTDANGNGGSFLNLTYLAGERVVPGYGGGMSSAKSALEGDTRTLAYEVGRKWGHRVNSISAGPYASRAASAIGFIQKIIHFYGMSSPLSAHLTAEEVAHAAAFLASPLSSGITGTVLHVDKGYHAMAIPHDVDVLLPK